jgi:hypothetical protein
VLLDQFDVGLAGEGECEADPHLGDDAAIQPLRRHERADQEPRPDVKKLRVLAHGFLNIGDRVGDLDNAVVARAETELIH